MRKRGVGERDRRPVIVGGTLLLLAATFVVVVIIKSQFFGDRRTDTAGQKEEQVSLATGAGRRNVYDRNFMELAVSFPRISLYARPLEFEASEEVVREMAKILSLDEKNIFSALKGERGFVWLGRDLSIEKAGKIAALNLKGVYSISQVQRYYPGNQLGAHVIGFIKDEQGLAGVESYYDSVLRGGGVYDSKLALAGLNGKIGAGGDSASLVLTIDIHLQNILEQKLKSLVEKTGAKTGVAILMAPDTGEIIALASLPDYDPNRFWEFSDEARRNRAFEDIFEPGAIGCLFQVAAAIDKGVVPAKSVVSGDELAQVTPENQVVTPAPETVQAPVWTEVQPGRYLSREALEIEQVKVGDDDFNFFAESIGLTAKGEVDLPEALFAARKDDVSQANLADSGMLTEKNPQGPAKALASKNDRGSFPTATPLALLSAFSRLLNGGKVITPHVLGAVWQNGQIWDVSVRRGIGEFAVRPEVSERMLAVMKKTALAGGDAFIIESMLSKEPVLEKTASEKTAKTADKGAAQSPKKEEGKEAVSGQTTMIRESILLGTAPLAHPEIAIVVVLEGGGVDLQGKSPVRILAEEMMPLARAALQKQPKSPTARELAVREVGYQKRMRMIQANPDQPAILAQVQQGLLMPDVRGLSGRKALQILQPYGVRLHITGSGQVAGQKPPPGTALKGVKQCVLNLKTMH